MFKQSIAAAMCAVMFSMSAFAGVSSDRASYRGGTVAIPNGTEAKIDLTGAALKFGTKKNTFTIPYKDVQTIEYGQKAGRRIGAAVAVTALISPLGLFMLMSKKRTHMVSVTWKSEAGETNGVVLECGKDIVRSVLTALEARSGKQVEYETEDARQHIGR